MFSINKIENLSDKLKLEDSFIPIHIANHKKFKVHKKRSAKTHLLISGYTLNTVYYPERRQIH